MSNPNVKVNNGVIEIKVKNRWTSVTFKDYEDIEIVGEPGANGIVVKGIHKITGREEAIKIWVPRKEVKNGEVLEEQYYAEIQKIAKLNHPNIVKVYNAWIEDSCYFCSMEYIDGETLKAWISFQRSKGHRLKILYKIFIAIKFYQDKGIIHGDIHANNILIDRAEEVHIIDFGTSVTSKYDEQSTYRENFLMYELVEKVMGDDFSKEAFLFKKYSLNTRIEKENDVRNVIPVFVSGTIIEYIKLEMIKLKIEEFDEIRELPEICECIARGLYINMDFYYKNMGIECDPNTKNVFPQVFYDTFEDVVFGETQKGNTLEEIQNLSLYVYYMNYKSIQDKIGQDVYVAAHEEFQHMIDKKVYDEYIKIFNQKNDLFDLHKWLLKQHDDENEIFVIEGDIRAVLESILSHFYNGYYLHVLRKEYLQMQQIKMNEKLYNKIINLGNK